jgi:hypothetical protein
MTKWKFILTVLIVHFLAACEKNNTPEANVVINELLPVNSRTCTDQNGEYDDWIELSSNSSVILDLSGYYLSDSRSNLNKWMFPEGSVIPANGYLVIWADGDTLQSGLHANFKLASDGEKIYFSNPDVLIIDMVEYPPQDNEIAYARFPDWSGEFIWHFPTFGISNNTR